MTSLAEILIGPMHASLAGRCLRRLIGATDLVLRRIYCITEFESAADGLLRVAVRRAKRDLTLSDGPRIRAGDRVIELHVWNEHFPRFPARIGDFGWPARIQQQMRWSLYRLAAHIRTTRDLDGVRALRMSLPVTERGPPNALARLLLGAGFERPAGAAPRWNWLLRFLDSLWVWLLTWAYNPRALIGWRFNRTRYEFWISRSRFLMVCVDRPGLSVSDRNKGTAAAPTFEPRDALSRVTSSAAGRGAGGSGCS